MKCVTKRVALIAEAASAAITLAVSLDAADYAYQQCTLIVYVWAVVEWTGACRGYDRSHRHQTLVVDDDENSWSPWRKFTFSESDMTLTRCHSFLVLNPA